MNQKYVEQPTPADVPNPVVQNIETIADLHANAERGVGRHQRAIETLTFMLGRPACLYLSACAIAAWILYNCVAAAAGKTSPDPSPFPLLQGITSAACLLLTIVVLITQNRLSLRADKRAHLDLQINLLTEQRTAKLIGLMEELRRDLPNVRDRVDAEATAMQKTADPVEVLQTLEEKLERSEDRDTSSLP